MSNLNLSLTLVVIGPQDRNYLKDLGIPIVCVKKSSSLIVEVCNVKKRHLLIKKLKRIMRGLRYVRMVYGTYQYY